MISIDLPTVILPPPHLWSSRKYTKHVITSISRRRSQVTQSSFTPRASSEDADTNTPADWLSVAATMTQLWAIVLPLGYAGVPLAAQALDGVQGGPAFAAAGVETIVLGAVWSLLQRRGYTPRINLVDTKSVGVGIAAGVAALAVNQLFAAVDGGGGGGVNQGVQETLGILEHGTLASNTALCLASAVLAPATEEIVYRGFLLSSCRALGVPAGGSVAVAAVLFALAHLQLAGVPQLAVVGMALGGASLLSQGNLVAPLIGHATYNGALLISLLLDVYKH